MHTDTTSCRHFLGHGLRNFTAAALALPADAACLAHGRLVGPAVNGLAKVVGTVAGSVAGVAGAVVGAAVETLSLSSVAGASHGFTFGYALVSVIAGVIGDLVNLAVDGVLTLTALLLRLLGWSVGAVATAPLMVFGRH